MNEKHRRRASHAGDIEIVVGWDDEYDNWDFSGTDDAVEQAFEDADSNALNVQVSIVDAGIGPYEYWGIRGWHSDVGIDEVTTDDVFFNVVLTLDEETERKLTGRSGGLVLPTLADLAEVESLNTRTYWSDEGQETDIIWTATMDAAADRVYYEGDMA